MPGTGGGALTADVVTQIQITAGAEITNHPIESGGEISDHVIRRPKTVAFDFAQSATTLRTDEMEWGQTPIQVRESQFKPTGLLAITMLAGQAVEALANAVGLGGGATEFWTFSAKDDEDRIQQIWSKLLEIRDAGALCTFAYQGIYLPDYALTRVSYRRSGGEGGLARFTLEAQEVLTVETAVAALGGSGVGLDVASASALSMVPLLPKGPSAVEAVEEEAVQKSLLASGLDALLP